MGVEIKDGKPTETQEITNETIATKVSKGEALTEKEREFVKGNPNLEDGAGEEPAEDVNDDGDEVPVETKDKKVAPKATESDAPDPTKKAGEPKKETSAPTPEDRRKLIEAELDKPRDQQDLTGFTESEIGTFIDLKKERSKNKRLVEENDALKFEKVKNKLKPTEEVVEDEDPTAKIGDEDIVTGKQLKEILGRKPKSEKKPEAGGPAITPDIVAAHAITADASLRAKGIDDYKDVEQWVQFALYDDPAAADVVKETAKSGGNVALECYYLVKGSKKWPQIKLAIETQKGKVTPAPAAKKEEAPPAENVERADRIKKNTEKVTTTGAGGGAGGDSGEYTREDVANMSTDDFRRLPRETRDRILKKFGSEPNLSK